MMVDINNSMEIKTPLNNFIQESLLINEDAIKKEINLDEMNDKIDKKTNQDEINDESDELNNDITNDKTNEKIEKKKKTKHTWMQRRKKSEKTTTR